MFVLAARPSITRRYLKQEASRWKEVPSTIISVEAVDKSGLGSPSDPLAQAADNKYFKLVSSSSQSDCESKCKLDGGCFAIEYGSSYNRCELRKVRPNWMAPVNGYSCLVMSGTTSKSAERTTTDTTTKHHEVQQDERTKRSHHQAPIPKASNSCDFFEDAHCAAAGENCIYDYSSSTSFCRGKGGIGEACMEDDDCTSNHCFYWMEDDQVRFACSECNHMNEDCDGNAKGGLCIQDWPNLPVCGPKLSTGASCFGYDDNCISNACVRMSSDEYKCAECTTNSDCAASGERCIYDSDGIDPAVCGPKAAIDECCGEDGDCASGFCHSWSSQKCVECWDSSDCDGNPKGTRCDKYSSFTCAGLGQPGDACDRDEDCVNNSCGEGCRYDP